MSSEGHECPSVHPLSVLVLEVWVSVLLYSLSYMSMTMGMCVVSTSLLSVCFFIFSSSCMCLSLCVISSTSLSLMSSVSTSSIYMNGIYSEGGGSL